MSTRVILNAQGEQVTLYGLAPPPEIDETWISLNPPGSSKPSHWLYPSAVGKEAGLAIWQFYYMKQKEDLSYMLNDKQEGKILPLNKGAIDFTLAEAKMVAKGLIEMLERFGYKRSSFLSE